VEGDGEQPLLAAAPDERRDVEERSRDRTSVLDDADGAALLDDVQPAGLAGRRCERERGVEAVDDRLEPKPEAFGSGRRRSSCRGRVGRGRRGRGVAVGRRFAGRAACDNEEND
jgi:hypothetical protein